MPWFRLVFEFDELTLCPGHGEPVLLFWSFDEHLEVSLTTGLFHNRCLPDVIPTNAHEHDYKCEANDEVEGHGDHVLDKLDALLLLVFLLGFCASLVVDDGAVVRVPVLVIVFILLDVRFDRARQATVVSRRLDSFYWFGSTFGSV